MAFTIIVTFILSIIINYIIIKFKTYPKIILDYPDKERNAVIDTVTKNFPLNTMYWAVRKNNTYEVIDGQQRIISICMYVNGDFSILVNGKNLAFHNLQEDQKKKNFKL